MRRLGVLGLLLAGASCGPADRCLDAGGRWSGLAGVCEFSKGPISTQAEAIEAGVPTLVFAYGDSVRDETPFSADLEGDVWHVRGSVSEGALGGAGHVWIERATGRVVKLIHDQ